MKTLTSRLGSLSRSLASRLVTVLLIAGAVAGGWYLREELEPVSGPAAMMHADAHESGTEQAAVPKLETVWTCSMHPQIQLSEFGLCPLCAMDLIPLQIDPNASDDVGADRRIKLSPRERKLVRIETQLVERRFVEASVRMLGKIKLDETRLAYLTAWAPGRLDRLFVDYTGVEVAAGDHMVSLYSPKVYTDQTALLSALSQQRSMTGSIGTLEARAIEATIDAARERLRQVGLSNEQIEEIEERGKPTDHITIHAPIGGVVVDKIGQQGMYVEEGTRIYTIADFSHLWLMLDAYESDLAWLHYGQVVEFTTEAYPGEVFVGTIAFLSRELDPKTQTIKVRVNLDNFERRLKPGMFVRAVVRTKVATRGRVMERSLAGKFICSMHPEIVRQIPGVCDLCGMDLVTTESLGYVPTIESEQEMPLVIPATAALRTGKRAVVYLEVENDDEIYYEGREIVLGPRAGDWYLVEDGLEEGDRVVTHGNFKLDSALQILAKPSMMSQPESFDNGETSEKPDYHDVRSDSDFLGVDKLPPPHSIFHDELDLLRTAYFEIQYSLFRDNHADAKLWADMGLAGVKTCREALPSTKIRQDWFELEPELNEAFKGIANAIDAASARLAFVELTDVIRTCLVRFDYTRDVYELECPMAYEDGARWLQNTDTVQNPYFDGSMKACGTVLGKLSELGDRDE